MRVLIVDDEKNIRTTLVVCLEQLGCEVRAVASAAAAVAEAGHFDLAFVDLRLGADDGLDLIAPLLAAQPELSIVIITAFGEIATAVEAVKRGAWDFVTKPFTPAQLRVLVGKVDERRTLVRRVAELE